MIYDVADIQAKHSERPESLRRTIKPVKEEMSMKEHQQSCAGLPALIPLWHTPSSLKGQNLQASAHSLAATPKRSRCEQGEVGTQAQRLGSS